MVPSLLGMIPVVGPWLVKVLPFRVLAIGGAVIAGEAANVLAHKAGRAPLISKPETRNLNTAGTMIGSTLVGAIAGPALGLLVGGPVMPLALIGAGLGLAPHVVMLVRAAMKKGEEA